ncbi:LOW QUALITY PROTEIN: microtubule-actin cross-linking factor 1-like [Gigantopelta aegis]|uniref:LOW QUALITY PROTEIN: microtubule-actin cross-linking factor 1-like n=1 Tax=Gigantopelta aegis TaxID=1735272 RepID=UPI001B887474|nr:LOW QUALITY PROTEIN: microtubule-actin cross-linking factor 1-like [Gigantopelta aegis]
MGSRKDVTTLEKCREQILQRQKQIRETPFGQNYTAIQQQLDDLHDQAAEVKDIKKELDHIKKKRGHTKDYENTERDFRSLEDAALQKKRCLETVLYVSEVENLYQNVQTDMEDRALYLSNRPKVFESVYRDEDVTEASRMHKNCIYALRSSWQWLTVLNKCMDVHMSNAAEFHQFHHDIRHLDEDMTTFLSWLNSEALRRPVQTHDPQLMLKHFRLITCQLLDYQSRMEKLCERSKSVFPIYYRREMPAFALTARALVNYQHQKISLSEGDSCTVLDNSDAEHWQVRTSDGHEAELPSIVLVIPPPDPKSFVAAQRLRCQLHVHWDSTIARLRTQLVQFMTMVAKETQQSQFKGLSANQKSSLMKLMNESTQLLRSNNKDDGEYTDLKFQLTNIRKFLSQATTGNKDLKNGTVSKWQDTARTFRAYVELLTYHKTFRKDVASRLGEENLVVTDVDNPPTFTSRAYFERALPIVDIDMTTKESRLTTVTAEIYIHERHRGKKPLAPPRRKRAVKEKLASKEYDNDLFSETTEITEVRSFVITGVLDPRNDKVLSVSQAIAKGILNQRHGTYNNPDTGYSVSIPEAINLGYVLVEYRDHMVNGDINHNGIAGLQNAMDTKKIPITGVIDPRTGEWISVKEAIAAGLIDPKTGKFRNPVTGEEMSLMDAIKSGYLIADPAAFGNDSEENGVFTSIELEDVAFTISGVIDPTTGEEISLKRAIQDGIIDPVNGVYRDPATGEVMSIADAIKRGLIKGRPFDPTRDKDDGNILRFQQLQVKKQRFLPSDMDTVDGAEMALKIDPNDKLFNKLKDRMDVTAKGIKDPKTKNSLTIEQAYEKGIINFATAEYDTLDGEILPLEEATARGLIEPNVLKQILKTYAESSVGDLIDKGQFDPDTGLVTDTVTGLTMSLQAAVNQSIIDPDTTFFYDVSAQRVTSLASAIKNGRCNLATGKIVRRETGEELSVSEAVQACQISPYINASSVAEHAETLQRLRGVMDTNMKGVKVATSNDLLSIEDAVLCGALNIPLVAYANERTSDIVPLQVAVTSDQVEPQAAIALFTALNKLSLQEAICSQELDPHSGKYVAADTKESLPIDVAQNRGIWNPDYVYFVDNETGNVTSLGSFMDRGKFDPKSGKVISNVSGQAMTIEQAIANGLITPHIDPEKYVDTTTTLKDLIDNGKVNPRSTDFVAPGDHKMSIRDALANGFLTMGSKVKLNPDTGTLELASDEEIVRALVDVKENSDWLSQVEQTLAGQNKPSEKLDKLKKQNDDSKVLKSDIEQKEPIVRCAIRQAEELIETNKDSRENDTVQQFKKLRYNTSDLKVRFDVAATEAGSRNSHLQEMFAELEDFYSQLENLDVWMDQAIEKSQDLQSLQGDIETQYSAFKDFIEEVKAKEDDIAKILKLSDSFRDNSQDFEREVDVYRKRVQILPTIKEESEAGILDDEIESIEAKYKDISHECAKHMDRLASLMKNKKAFNDLNDRLNSSYQPLQDQIGRIVDENMGHNPEKDSRDLNALKSIKADLIGQERKLKDLSAAGDRLSAGLQEAGLQYEADEVRSVIDDHHDKHTALLGAVKDKEEKLEASVAQQQNVMNRLDGVIAMVDDAENSLSHPELISLNKEHLAQQLQEQRIMNADIGSNRSLLDRLSQEAGADAALSELQDRLEEVEKKADARTAELEEVSTRIADFEDKVSDLDAWLTDSIQSLKVKPKTANQKAMKAKVDALYEAKRDREEYVDALRDTCRGLMENERVCDRYAVKECLADTETKWNDLTEFLVQQVSLEALSEIDGMLKYLDKAENEINTAEPISVEPETLTVQLKDHSSFNEDLMQKRNAVKDIINKCNKMLRETTNEQTDEIKSRLDSIRAQADIVCQLSAERLQQLEAALPLASHYSENQSEVQAWLDEMEAELKAQGKPGESLEQVRKQHDNLKGTQLIIEDHKPFIDDLNSTGLELMDLCGDGDAGEIQSRLLATNKRYETLKSQARHKARELTDCKKKLTQEVTDTMDNLLEEVVGLNQTVTNADPIPATPEKLKNEIDENKAVLEDLERMKPYIVKAEEIAKNVAAHGVDDPAEAEDIRSKVVEIKELGSAVRDRAEDRQCSLDKALKVSDKFYDLCSDVMSGLRDLKDSLYSQEPPGIDGPTIREQQNELTGIKKELEKAKELMGECSKMADDLCIVCGDPGRVEVQKQMEDLVNMADDVNDMAKDRGEELRNAYQHADKFQHLLESVMSWLPLSEHKLASMRAPTSDPDTLRDQIEEVKLFKSQVHPHIVDMQQLNQQVAALKDLSPVAAETLLKPVQEANEKWNELIRGIAERESKLNDMQVKVGEVTRAMDDIICALQQANSDLEPMDKVKGDPKFLETHMRKLQLIQADIRNQDKTCQKLNKATDDIIARVGDEDSGLTKKRDAMNGELRSVHATARDKEHKLQETLRQTKRYLGGLEDTLQWINEFRVELKTNAPFGALPETAEKQYEKFMARTRELEGKEKAVHSLLTAGQDILDTCRPEDVTTISEKLKKLRDRWQDTRTRAAKRKEKMEEHLQNVGQFHDTLKAFTDWLNNAEISMRRFKYPSKLVPTVAKQIEDHNALKSDLESQADNMLTLDRTGTYLKYFGRKQDTIYIKNLLVGIRLRWKKLLRRTDERGRLLQQAYKEDKRFHDAWQGLCDWLDESSKMLVKYMEATKQPSATKQDIDQLKRFQHQLSSKHPIFYSTTRLGRNLKDRCTKQDPEREVLQSMLDDLKNKWNSVRSVVSKSQNKLDEALLTSGRVSDALNSLLEWLNKAETTIADDQPVLGDLDTVHMLFEQHRAIQQELAAREPTIATMKSASNLPASQIEDLTRIWDRVNHLSDVRENRLRNAMTLAEEFQEVVTTMREFLPHAESELKFRALPDDEVAIIQLIERHEKFMEGLRGHQEMVERIKQLAEEILSACHPNAIRFVKYYLTITQTRWDQLLLRAKNRAARLQDALRNIQGNAALLEELLAWLTDAQALLATKERDPIPDDLKVVETLLKEHLEFHEEVTSKNSDAERLTKLVSLENKQKYGSNMRLNDSEGYNPRVMALQAKWRTVWRMSVDRKKMLQDAHDTLMELESFKNFNFDLWRQRYLNWVKAKKYRITDFFRRQDKDCDGFVSREEFVMGMLKSKFPSNKTELNAVFDIFDKRGFMDYKDFIDALKPDKNKSARAKAASRQKPDVEVIHDEIERDVSLCQCRHQFKAEFIEEGKYRFGETQKVRLVRFLNSTVMVRVGGGWITLEEFLEANDPCRARGRTNFDLRDTLLLPDGSQQSVTSSTSRRGSTPGRSISPFPTGARRRQNDTGYASSNSSAGSSAESSLRRSRITSSMVNLSSHANHSPSLNKNPEFGSTGSLSRSKRISTSSSSLASNQSRNMRTPTPGQSPTSSTPRRNSSTFVQRSKTPTPTSSFGSTPRSRPTTPTTPFSPRTTSTPQRPGSTTPTKGMRTRRLPSTPTQPKAPQTGWR